MIMHDLRTLKTEESINNELILLLKKMPFEDITVSRIISDCRINRSTFYRHYHDKYDLAEKLSDELLQKYKNALHHLHLEDGQVNTDSMIPLLHYFKDNREILFVLNNRKLPIHLFEEMRENTAEHLEREILRLTRHSGNEQYIRHFAMLVAEDLLQTIKWWHENYLDHTDEEILELMKKILDNTIYPNINR